MVLPRSASQAFFSVGGNVRTTAQPDAMAICSGVMPAKPGFASCIHSSSSATAPSPTLTPTNQAVEAWLREPETSPVVTKRGSMPISVSLASI